MCSFSDRGMDEMHKVLAFQGDEQCETNEINGRPTHFRKVGLEPRDRTTHE